MCSQAKKAPAKAARNGAPSFPECCPLEDGSGRKDRTAYFRDLRRLAKAAAGQASQFESWRRKGAAWLFLEG